MLRNEVGQQPEHRCIDQREQSADEPEADAGILQPQQQQYEELDEAFEYDDRYIAPLVTYLTYKLRLALLQRNAGKRKRGIWWVLVHVEMQGYYVEIFSAEFENLLTELRDAVIPMLHTEYVQMLNGKRE